MTGPPIKRSAPGRRIAGAAKPRSKALYKTPVLVQDCFRSREREVARLLNEHLTTGRENHWQAFRLHVTGMVKRAGRAIALTFTLSLHPKRDCAEAEDAVEIQGAQLELNLIYDNAK